MGSEDVLRVMSWLEAGPAELKEFLLPRLPAAVPSASPEAAVPTVGSAGQRLETARASLSKATKKLDKAKSQVEKLREQLVEAQSKVSEGEQELAEARRLHDKALSEYNSVAKPEGDEASLPDELAAFSLDKIESELKLVSERQRLLEQARRKLDVRDEGDAEIRHIKVRRLQAEADECRRQAQQAAQRQEELQQRADKVFAEVVAAAQGAAAPAAASGGQPGPEGGAPAMAPEVPDASMEPGMQPQHP